ncbi:unnamed protein product, partial [Allacma fusca]
MNSDEINFDIVSHDPNEVDPIVIENGSFSWNGPEDNALEN